MKHCKKCHELKDLSAFSINKAQKPDGRCTECKVCQKRYYENDKDRFKKATKRFNEKHPDYQADWRKAHPHYQANYYVENIEHINGGGIVYIWFDKLHERYYIGAKWGGSENYICSSTWMKLEHNKRPEDFKRRILSRHESLVEMHDEEFRLLKMIKKEELGARYYNLRIQRQGEHSKANVKEATMKLAA